MGQQTCSAHPARFSPDDKYSRHRITVKKRFKVLMTQQPRPVLWGPLTFNASVPPAAPQRLRNEALQSVSLEAFLPPLLFVIRSHHCIWSCFCEAIVVASLFKGTRSNLFLFWITARLLKWFERALILYVVGRKEWFKNKSKNGGDESEEYPRRTKDHLERKTSHCWSRRSAVQLVLGGCWGRGGKVENC